MNTYLIIASSVLIFCTYASYIWSIIYGKSKPHRTTRLVYLIIFALETVSLFVQHDEVTIWLALFTSINCLIVFLLSLKYGMGGWSKIDICCLLVAILGIVIWQISKDPFLGLYTYILADLIGVTPTIIKTIKHPETEFWLSYMFNCLAALCTIFAVESVSIHIYVYPIYILTINSTMLILALRVFPIFRHRKGNRSFVINH